MKTSPLFYAGNELALSWHETPQSDPAGVLLAKYDAETTYSDDGNNAMGNAKLNGAKYKVSYYAGYYDTVSEAEASGTLKRSWVYETDELGMFHLQNDAPISGDDVYKRNGTTVLPLGTIVIEEVEAPEGYNLPEPFGKPTSFIQKITGVGTSNFVYTYNTVKQDGRAAALRSAPHRCAARTNRTESPRNEPPCINLMHTACEQEF